MELQQLLDHSSRPGLHEPFTDGGDALVALIVRLSGAEAGSLFLAATGSDALLRRASFGDCIPDVQELRSYDLDRLTQRKGLAVLPLHTGGLVSAALVLSVRNPIEAEQGSLKKLVPILATLVRYVSRRGEQIRLAKRISDLELEIAAGKILDRLGEVMDGGQPRPESLGQVERHITTVLSSCEFDEVLRGQLRQLEASAADAEQTTQAKRTLQSKLGYSEQQAYELLRSTSRRQRQRIGDLAKKINAGYVPPLS